MAELEWIKHPIEPFYDSNARILILGSFPSVKSREQMFFYGHKQNRFWKVMAAVLQEEVPQTIDDKKRMLQKHKIAVYDVIYSCEIAGSSDSSIRNVTPTDLKTIVRLSQVNRIFCNGKTAGGLYAKYQEKITGIVATTLPSTSPANAMWNMDRLIEEWKKILDE